MLALLLKIVKLLNSEQSPGQLACAISLAAIFGLTPLLSLHNLFVLLVVLWFRVNLTLFLVSWPVFTLFGIGLAPLFDSVGTKVLQLASLQPLWQSFFNTLIGRWSNFYYSGVMGSLCVSLLAALLLYPLCRYLIQSYRDKWLKHIEKYQLIKILKASKLWQLYQGLNG